MAKVIAVINQKGGVGKTTTAVQIGSLLRVLKYKVLMIDMDPQCNLSFASKGNLENYSILDALLSNAYAKDIVQNTKYYDLIVSNGNLASYALRLNGEKKEYRFKEVIEPLKEMYDYIIVDSPPTLGEISVGILTAADSMIIPVNADIYSLEGLKQIYLTYDAVKKYTNKNIVIDGILLTRVSDTSDSVLYPVFEKFANALKVRLLKSKIHESAYIKKTNIMKKPVWVDQKSNDIVIKDYINLTRELLKIWGGAK